MKTALDTSVVLRNAQRNDPQHARVAAYLEQVVQEGSELCIPLQVVCELWVSRRGRPK